MMLVFCFLCIFVFAKFCDNNDYKAINTKRPEELVEKSVACAEANIYYRLGVYPTRVNSTPFRECLKEKTGIKHDTCAACFEKLANYAINNCKLKCVT